MSRPCRTLRVCLGVSTLLGAAALLLTSNASAISREQVITTAKSFVYHPWHCGTENLTASCSSSYKSEYQPGDYLGLPYDWGGYMSLFTFDQQIAAGYGAGSPAGGSILDCTAGVDCSGYASQCLGVSYHTTSDMPSITQAITKSELLAGDIINKVNYHVVLFSHLLNNGEPYLYESSPPNVRVNAVWGWSYLSGYTPRRLTGITGTSAGDPVGTLTNPIVIGGFPYTDSRNTTQSVSDVLHGCGAAPTLKEEGPEYVYQATFTQPGSLTVSVSDDVGVDIDVHLYATGNTSDCLARHDSTFTTNVDCGTYLIVADTYSGGSEQPGAYTLNVTFTPSGAACGSGPKTYTPKGKLGESCTEEYPYCNMTLGADVCILTKPASSSFCSKACQSAADCSEFPGGCCVELGDPGSGDYYCLKGEFCPSTPDAGPESGTGGASGAGGSSGAGGTGGTGGDPGQGGSSGQAGSPQGGSGGSAGTTAQGGSGGTSAKGGSAGAVGKGGASGAPGSGGAGGQPGEDAGSQAPAAEDDSSGCGCRTADSSSSPKAWLLVSLLLIGWFRRQSRSPRQRC